MNKVTGMVLILLLFSGFAFASSGDYMVAPDGKHFQLNSNGTIPDEAIRIKSVEKPEVTLNRDEFMVWWPGDGGTHYTFGIDVNDSAATYMVPLTECEIHKVFFYNTDFTGELEWLLHESDYAGDITTGACIDANGWIGYWGTPDDSSNCNPDIGNCIWIEGDNECMTIPPYGPELWPDMGIGGWPITLDINNNDQWNEIDLASLGYPTTSDPFFIDAYVVSEDLIGDPDSWGIGVWGTAQLPYHMFKYYWTDGTSGNDGWHIRNFGGWEVYALVEYLGDIPPFIEDMTVLYTTTSTDPRDVSATIYDVNPTGGNAGVAEALLWYCFNEGDSVSIAMTAVVDTFTASIPGGVPGDHIDYWITATDVEGLSSTGSTVGYDIFEPVEDNIIVNNGSLSDGTVDYYYLYNLLGEFPHDMWNGANFGPAPDDLWLNYTTVLDISGGGPEICEGGLDAFLDQGGTNLILAGDEWMGACVDGWAPTDFVPGDFVYDYLGMDASLPDVNYSTSGDQGGISRLMPVAGDPISGALATFLEDSLLLNYDPNYEIGVSNWLDGAVPTADASVSYYGLTGILDSLGAPPPDADTVASALYLELANGSQTAWFGFDVLSLNTVPSYHWIGIYPEGPLPQTIEWMDAYTGVDDEVQIPSAFALRQNYPNPFNPVTSIEFELPNDGNITLSVYNMLGQKVAMLVDEYSRAGVHTVKWDGRNDLGQLVSTGVYLYRINAGNFNATKKMILLK